MRQVFKFLACMQTFYMWQKTNNVHQQEYTIPIKLLLHFENINVSLEALIPPKNL